MTETPDEHSANNHLILKLLLINYICFYTGMDP